MANGFVTQGIVDVGSVQIGSGSSTTLMSWAMPSNTTVFVHSNIGYQGTESQDNGMISVNGIGKRATAGSATVIESSTSDSISWGQTAPTLAASGSSIKVTVTSSEGTVRFWGTLNITSVEQVVSAG